ASCRLDRSVTIGVVARTILDGRGDGYRSSVAPPPPGAPARGFSAALNSFRRGRVRRGMGPRTPGREARSSRREQDPRFGSRGGGPRRMHVGGGRGRVPPPPGSRMNVDDGALAGGVAGGDPVPVGGEGRIGPEEDAAGVDRGEVDAAVAARPAEVVVPEGGV